jgi:transketolase
MSAVQWKLGNLIAIVDFNNQQADGPSRNALATAPGTEGAKWAAFGWHAQEVDGNDLNALVAAFDAARADPEPRPRVIICNTRMCKGIRFLEAREITHFIRVEPDEWARALAVLDEERPL